MTDRLTMSLDRLDTLLEQSREKDAAFLRQLERDEAAEQTYGQAYSHVAQD